MLGIKTWASLEGVFLSIVAYILFVSVFDLEVLITAFNVILIGKLFCLIFLLVNIIWEFC